MRGQNKVKCMRNGRWKENILREFKTCVRSRKSYIGKEKFKSHMSSQTRKGFPYSSRSEYEMVK